MRGAANTCGLSTWSGREGGGAVEGGEREGRSRRLSRVGGEEPVRAGDELDAPGVCCSSFVALVGVSGADVVLTGHRGGDAEASLFPSSAIGNLPI